MASYERDVQKISRRALASLTWRLRLTRCSMVLERVARCFWPLIALTLAVLAVLRLGLAAQVSQSIVIGATAVAVIAWLVLFAWGARRFNWPSRAGAIARMDATLDGRPLAALQDKQAIGSDDAGARYLWSRHVERMAEAAKHSTAVQPDLRLARRDPWALRLVAILLFAGAVMFGRSDPVQSLVKGLQPADVLSLGPTWEGWADPPRYTGKPAVYLNELDPAEVLILPQGTRITLRVYGDGLAATLEETVSGAVTEIPEGDDGLAEVTFEVTQSGRVALMPVQGVGPTWDVDMLADAVPTVALSGEVTRTVQGALQMPFKAEDDYGVIGGQVTISLALDQVDRRYGLEAEPEAREVVTLDVPMPFTRDTTAFEETVVEDLAKHPWAGLPVKIELSVFDDLQQVGVAPLEVAPMPGKRFFDPMAGSVAEMRRDLLWNRSNALRVTQVLKALTVKPEVAFERRGEKPYLMIRTALRRLEYNRETLSDEVRDEVADLLWNAALLIEDGDLADARERLKRAQERLSEAMKDGATQDEIAELMDELRRATQEYLRQLAEEQRNNPERQQAQNGERQEMSQNQLQEMMDRIQELMEQGRMDEAQQLMDQLQQMMENMQVTEGGEGQQGQNDQAMEGLGDTLREQQDLADETYRQLQEEYNQNRQQQQQGNNQQGQRQGEQPGQQRGQQDGENQQGQGQGGERQMDQNQLAERQRALREMLEQQQREFDQNGVQGGEGFAESMEEAERQMGQAQENLEEGNSSGALDNQADAMEALREGMRQLGEAQRQAQAQEQGSQGNQPGQPGQQRRDPLGRPLSETGQAGTDERLLPTEEQFRRSREVMDEIRKRSGDRSRPEIELDYLERLLDRF